MSLNKCSYIFKTIGNSLKLRKTVKLLPQRQNFLNYTRFFATESENVILFLPEFLDNCFCSISGSKPPENPQSDAAKGPQLLSKLFPQTAIPDQAEIEAEQKKKEKVWIQLFLVYWIFY